MFRPFWVCESRRSFRESRPHNLTAVATRPRTHAGGSHASGRRRRLITCTASRRRCSSCSTSAAPRSTFRCAATRPPLLASCARQQSGSLWRCSLTHVLTNVLADQRGLADVGAHAWSRSALRFGRRAPRSVLVLLVHVSAYGGTCPCPYHASYWMGAYASGGSGGCGTLARGRVGGRAGSCSASGKGSGVFVTCIPPRHMKNLERSRVWAFI